MKALGNDKAAPWGVRISDRYRFLAPGADEKLGVDFHRHAADLRVDASEYRRNRGEEERSAHGRWTTAT